MAPSPPCSLESCPRCQQAAGGTKQGMRKRFSHSKLGQEVGAAGTAPSWAGQPCPVLGAACGAGAGGRTRSRCPWAQSVGAGIRHGSPWLTLGTEVSPLIPISPPFSTTPFHASFRGLVCTGMRLLQRPTGTPLCRQGAGVATPVSPNTSVQINLLPPTPLPGFLGSLRVLAAPRGPWRGGTGWSHPRPHRFLCCSVSLPPVPHIWVWGTGLGGGVGGVSCPFWGRFRRRFWATCEARWSL